MKSSQRDKRMLGWDDLWDRGVPYSKNHLRRLWGVGRFPAPRNLSTRCIVWDEGEVQEWIVSNLEAPR
jgi:predicted DNA-binding transcriptional regulator AlpA